MLRQWQQHPDFADVLDPELLLALPTEERVEWMQWRGDVAAFQNKLAQ
jgi:hypothetical protein